MHILTPPRIIKPSARLLADLERTVGDIKLLTNRELFKNIIVIEAPKNFSTLSVSKFLYNIEYVFGKKRYLNPVLFTLNDTRQISLTGLMLVYKFVSYTATNNIIVDGSSYAPSPAVDKELKTCGFDKLIDAHIKNAGNTALPSTNTLRLKQYQDSTRNLFLFPQRLIRSEENLAENTKGTFTSNLARFYCTHNKNISIWPIAHCVSELISNFWSHATEESQTIVAAKGNPENFQLSISDNGEGIISSLRAIFPNKRSDELLKTSLSKGISSKRDVSTGNYHMGYGLYHVSELAKINNGFLNIWSEGYHLHCSKKQFWVKKCGYWRGTIVDLNISTSDLKGLKHIHAANDNGIKLNVRRA